MTPEQQAADLLFRSIVGVRTIQARPPAPDRIVRKYVSNGRMAYEVEIDGVRYTTMRQAARALHVDPRAIRERVGLR